jgi:hypothetical protein
MLLREWRGQARQRVAGDGGGQRGAPARKRAAVVQASFGRDVEPFEMVERFVVSIARDERC